jgi:hypothetical protein
MISNKELRELFKTFNVESLRFLDLIPGNLNAQNTENQHFPCSFLSIIYLLHIFFNYSIWKSIRNAASNAF